MREILFRGKRIDNGQWIYGYYIKATHHWHNHGIHEDWVATDTVQNGGWCNVRGKYAVIPETIGQFTGITDENNNKVFEGDIVKAIIHRCYGSNPQIREETKIIAYDSLGILCLKDSEDVWSDFMNELNLSGCIDDFYFEIIGNIHDNPELLRTPQNDEVRE